MNPEMISQSRRRWHAASRFAAWFLIAFSCLQLLLWMAGVSARLLAQMRSSWIVMGPKPTIAFILLATGALLIERGRSRRSRTWCRVLCFWVIVPSALVITQYLGGMDLGVDHLLAVYQPDPQTHEPVMRPMSLLIGCELFLLSLSLALISTRQRRLHVMAQICLGIAVVLVLLPFLGYLLNIAPLYRSDNAMVSVSLESVVGVGVSVAMILFARPHAGWMGIATADDPGGAMVRRTLPVLVMVLLSIAWAVSTYFQRYGGFSAIEEMDLAYSCAVNLAILFGVVTWVGRSLHLLDRRRRQTEFQRRQSAIALEASERQYRFLTNSLPQMVWTCDSQGAADYFNDRWTEYTGVSHHETLARSWMDMIHPDDRARTRQAWTSAISRLRPAFDVEFRLLRADGLYRWHLARAVPLEDSQGGVIRWFGTCTDVDDQKKVAQQLRAAHGTLERRVDERTQELAAKTRALDEARRGAEAANEAKSIFLANVSHEVRTPLTAIVGFSDTLQRAAGALDPELRDALSTIHRNSRHLLQIVNDLLDLSKIEAGKLETETIACNLAEQVGIVMQTFRLPAQERQLGYRLLNTSRVPQTVLTDPLRLRQILMNLLSNAVKFTQRGEITVQVVCLADSTRGGMGELSIEVVDTGIGIRPDELSRLFQPFTQADSSTTRRFGGTGLGLTISRRLAQLLGGKISVQSELGVGTSFTLWVPVGIPADTLWISDLPAAVTRALVDVGESRPAQLRGRILLAEDGPDNQRLLAAILRKAGADVEIVAEGAAAVRAALARTFDVILMDMQMPGKDGYTATRELRAAGCATPILALTAHAMAEDRERCLAAGCTDYLTKPIEEFQFLAAVSQQMGAARQRLVPAANAAPRAAGPVSVRSRYADHPVIGGLLPQFIRDLQRQLAEARDCVNTRDGGPLAELMHRIKGAGGAYGFDALTRQAAAIESQIADACGWEEVEKAFNEIAAYAREIALTVEAPASV